MDFASYCPYCQRAHLFPANTPINSTTQCQNCRAGFTITRPEQRQEALMRELCDRVKMINIVIWIGLALSGVLAFIGLATSLAR